MDILYRKDGVLAVDKPSGLFVHPTALDRRCKDHVLGRLEASLGEKLYPIHRLDRPTSGVLVLGESREAAQELSKEFLEGNVFKEYLALVRGWVAGPQLIDYPLKNLDTGRLQEAKAEITEVEHLEIPIGVGGFSTGRYSLLKIRLWTGRQHQIRRHLKHMSHPIIGDTRYGKGVHNNFFREQFSVDRLMLHSSKVELSFFSNKLSFASTHPSTMVELLKNYGLKLDR